MNFFAQFMPSSKNIASFNPQHFQPIQKQSTRNRFFNSQIWDHYYILKHIIIDYMSKKVPTTEPTRRSTGQSLASKTPMSKMLPTFTTPSKPIYENESSSLAISKAL
jgi:hypothetical protein